MLGLVLFLSAASGVFATEWTVEVTLDEDSHHGPVRAVAMPFASTVDAALFTAWDGGARSDPRVASLLERNGLRGTFFLTPDCPALPYAPRLLAGGMEIGSNGISGQRLSLLSPSEIDYELRASRARLELSTGVPVTSFSYPRGDDGMRKTIRQEIADRLLAAGYLAVRASADEPAGVYWAPVAELRETEVPGLHTSDEPGMLRVLGDVTRRGAGFGTGSFASAWEYTGFTPGIGEYLWGDLAGLLRQWAKRPNTLFCTVGEAAEALRLARSVTCGPVSIDHSTVRATVASDDTRDAPQGLSLLLAGVDAGAATVNGVAAEAVASDAGLRVALAPAWDVPLEPVRVEPLPAGWQLSVETDPAGLPTGLRLSGEGALADTTSAQVTFEAPCGWEVAASDEPLALADGTAAEHRADLTAPLRRGARMALFTARVAPEGSPGITYLATAECPVPPSDEEAGSDLAAALTVCDDSAASTDYDSAREPASELPLGGYRALPRADLDFRDCYVDLRGVAPEKAGTYRTVFLRGMVEVPTDRTIRVDVLTTSNMAVWWDGEPLSRLENLTRPRARAEALVPGTESLEVSAGRHELWIAFRAGVADVRDESGFFAFLVDPDGNAYDDLRYVPDGAE